MLGEAKGLVGLECSEPEEKEVSSLPKPWNFAGLQT